MENIFINLMNEGKIRSLDDLKSVFRKIAKKTHPDAAGSDTLVRKFIVFRKQYEDACRHIISGEHGEWKKQKAFGNNYRYMFFREMLSLYYLETSFQTSKTAQADIKIKSVMDAAYSNLRKWNAELAALYLHALPDYEKIKTEKYKNIISNLRKPQVFFNLRPVIFNLVNYHITGISFYKKQIRQNLNAVIKRLDENGYTAYREYLIGLINDMDNGPALTDLNLPA